MNEKLDRAVNKLAKWRSVFAGWQLGTRTDDDPECAAVKDHREVTILLRAEVNALTRLLLGLGVTQEQLQAAILEEVQHLDRSYERRFPGISSSEHGMVYTPEALETMRGWLP